MDDPENRALYLADRLSYLAKPFSEAGDLDATTELLDLLLSVAPARESSTIALHLDETWFPQLEGALKRLSEASPEATYRMLMTRLREAIAASGPDTEAHSSVWRRAVENHEQDRKIIDVPLHFLHDATRDALLTWSTHDLDAAATDVSELLQSESVVFRRLALWALRAYPEIMPRLRGRANREWVMACGVAGFPSGSGSTPGARGARR